MATGHEAEVVTIWVLPTQVPRKLTLRAVAPWWSTCKALSLTPNKKRREGGGGRDLKKGEGKGRQKKDVVSFLLL